MNKSAYFLDHIILGREAVIWETLWTRWQVLFTWHRQQSYEDNTDKPPFSLQAIMTTMIISQPACKHPNLDLCPTESNPKLGNATRCKVDNNVQGRHQKNYEYEYDDINSDGYLIPKIFAGFIPFCGDSCRQSTLRLPFTHLSMLLEGKYFLQYWG